LFPRHTVSQLVNLIESGAMIGYTSICLHHGLEHFVTAPAYRFLTFAIIDNFSELSNEANHFCSSNPFEK
ncbi:MAG: hypothetical protein ACKO8H_25670, partial [Microcystis panniformis]